MLSKYNSVDIEHALLTTSPPAPFPPASNRDAWNEIRSALGDEQVADLIGQAEADVQSPIPALPATLYLEFVRNGQREGYQTPYASS